MYTPLFILSICNCPRISWKLVTMFGAAILPPLEIIVLDRLSAWLVDAAPCVNSLIHTSFDSRGNIACGLENRPCP